MKVYVLLYDNGYDGWDFHGVYSSEDKAKEKIQHFSKAYHPYFEIEEREIDEELK